MCSYCIVSVGVGSVKKPRQCLVLLYQKIFFWYLCFILLKPSYSTTAQSGIHHCHQTFKFAIRLSFLAPLCRTACITCRIAINSLTMSWRRKIWRECVNWLYGSCVWVSLASSSFHLKYLNFTGNASFFTRKNGTAHDPLAIYNVYHIHFYTTQPVLPQLSQSYLIIII